MSYYNRSADETLSSLDTSLKGLTAQPPPYLVTSDEQWYLTVTVNTQIIDGEVYVIAMNM